MGLDSNDTPVILLRGGVWHGCNLWGGDRVCAADRIMPRGVAQLYARSHLHTYQSATARVSLGSLMTQHNVSPVKAAKMARTFDPDDRSRFENFNIISISYKTIHKHAIRADVIYTKSLLARASPESRPLIVRFHGGGWIGADSLFPGFFAPWHLQLAEREGAVIVSPNYRLFPEADVRDILDDVEDFWTWLHSDLPSSVERETNGTLKVDLGRILVAGDSAGGHLSLSLALSHPEGIRAVTAAYPGIDTKSPAFFEPRTQPVFGLPTFPKSAWTDHIEQLKAQQDETGEKVVVSSDPRIDRAPLMWACTQQGLFEPYLLPEDRSVHILDRIEDGARFPRGGVFIWHAAQDSVVPVEGTVKLQKLIEALDPELRFRVHIAEGEHGFDLDASIEDEWMKQGLDDIVARWLG